MHRSNTSIVVLLTALTCFHGCSRVAPDREGVEAEHARQQNTEEQGGEQQSTERLPSSATSQSTSPILSAEQAEALRTFDLSVIGETRAIAQLHGIEDHEDLQTQPPNGQPPILYEISSESFIIGEVVFLGAYNAGATLALANANADSGAWDWEPIAVPWFNSETGEMEQRATVVNPSWDSESGRLDTHMKSRGLGDCGTWATHYWQIDEQTFCLHELRHQPTCTGTDIEWPIVFRDDACAQSYTGHAQHAEHGHEHREHGGHGHEHRFQEPSEHVERWESEARLRWQRPEELIRTMDIAQGMVVADLGAGTGFLLPWLDDAVGETGTVIAVDIEQSMLDHIAARQLPERTPELMLAQPDRPPFEEASVDRVVSVNVWHHIADRESYARALHASLREGGRFYIVDYTPASPTGPPPGMRVSASDALRELLRGGLRPRLRVDSLPRQYIIEVR